MMDFWRRLRFGYEQDLDERAHAIASQSYRDALILTFLLALFTPLVTIASGQIRQMSFLWPYLPAATVLVVILLAQFIRIARGGVTWRVALVSLGAIAIYAAVAWASNALFSTALR
jgi:hypothetical protein